MTFVHPILAIVGAACIAVPIIIHILMRRRRKPVPWAAMRFLLEAFRQQRRRLRLEQLLLLAARCLLVLLAGLAIARPLLGAAGLLSGRGPMTMYVLIDNGLASSATEGSGGAALSALDRHKKLARELLGQLEPAMGDRAGLIALGGPAESLVVPASTESAAIGELVDGLKPTDSPADIEGAFETLRAEFDREAASAAAAQGGGRTVVVLLSDYLKGSADTERPLPSLLSGALKGGITLVSTAPAREGVGNVTITGVEPLRSVAVSGGTGGAGQAQVRVMLVRTGPAVREAAATAVRVDAVAVPLRAGRAPGGGPATNPFGRAVVRWSAGQSEASASVNVPLPPDLEGATLSLSATIDHDAIEGDNLMRRPVEVRTSIRVGLVAPHRPGAPAGVQEFEPSDWFRLALEPEERAAGGRRGAEFEFSEIDPGALDAARLAGLDAVFVPRPDAVTEEGWKRLRAFAEAGGLIVVCPPAVAGVNLWPDVMARELGLDWSAAREVRVHEGGLAVSAERAPVAAGEDLLSVVGAELADLVGSVRVSRTLPVEFGAGKGDGRSSARALLAASNGEPLVVSGAPGQDASEPGGASRRGLVVYIASAFAFDWTDLQARPLMVPLIQEIVRQGVGRAHASWSALAGTRPEAPARTVELRPVADGAAVALGVGPDGRTMSPVRVSGLWRAVDERGAPRAILAVNADPRGGDGQAQTPASVEAWLVPASPGVDGLRWIDAGGAAGTDTSAARDMKRTIDAENSRDPFTLPLLLGAVALALLELALARWFSHASAGREAGLSAPRAGPGAGREAAA